MIKNKGGRPAKELSKEQLKELEELAVNMTIEQIADYFGISERTFYELKNRDSAVSAAYQKGKAAGIKKATNLLWELMEERNITAIIFYLKTRGGWSEKQEIDLKTSEKLPAPQFIFEVDGIVEKEGAIFNSNIEKYNKN
jgi:DNA-binding CsgD family transcriptional regulator